MSQRYAIFGYGIYLNTEEEPSEKTLDLYAKIYKSIKSEPIESFVREEYSVENYGSLVEYMSWNTELGLEFEYIWSWGNSHNSGYFVTSKDCYVKTIDFVVFDKKPFGENVKILDQKLIEFKSRFNIDIEPGWFLGFRDT